MPKKSNKTEHVLNLISKNEESPDEADEASETGDTEEEQAAAQVRVKQNEAQELKIEKKINIELDPEISIKEPAEGETPAVIKVPIEAVAKGSPAVSEPDEEQWPRMHPEEKRCLPHQPCGKGCTGNGG